MRTKILRKIFNTTITMFVILTVFTITTYEKNNTLRTNVEIKNISNITTNEVYLKNEDNYLVKTNIFLENGKNIIPNIINYLTIANKKTPVGLNSYIPKNTKLLSYKQSNDLVTLNFSKEFLSDEKNKQLIITGVVYSLLEQKDIKNVKIEVEEIPLSGYNEILNKNIGINNKYLFNTRYDINKVVVYYIDKISNENYYVPVTKYLNDKREKIEIIVDELKKTENNLVSYLNENTKLINYREEANVLFLNFNEYLLDENKEISKEILNTIAYSVFDNYNVNVVCFETNSKRVDMITNE